MVAMKRRRKIEQEKKTKGRKTHWCIAYNELGETIAGTFGQQPCTMGWLGPNANRIR